MSENSYIKAILSGGWSAWRPAFLEILVVTTISLVPLLAGVFREMLVPTGVQISPFQRAFLGGQLIFYAVGLTATVIWLSNRDWHEFYPWRSIINLLCFIVVGLCCIAVGADPTLQTLDRSVVAYSSVALFLVALVMYLFMALVAQVHPNLRKSLAKADADLSAAVKKSRGIE